MFLPIEQIVETVVVLTGDHKWMASAAFVIKKGKHIDIYLQQILVQMDIVGWDWIRYGVKMITLKHIINVKIHSIAIIICFWKLLFFEEVEYRIAKAPLVIVFHFNDRYIIR